MRSALLPLAPEPFTAPTDRDMLPSERREFVRTHRTCVFGYRRRNDGPAMSIVYYIPTDTDELLVSTMAGRGKQRIVERDRHLAVDVMMAVAGRMSGQALTDEARPAVEEMCDRENRVVIRCRPYSSYATPPRHLHRNDQVEKLSHWVSGVVPWDAADPS
jgi:hypothetical protein